MENWGKIGKKCFQNHKKPSVNQKFPQVQSQEVETLHTARNKDLQPITALTDKTSGESLIT